MLAALAERKGEPQLYESEDNGTGATVRGQILNYRNAAGSSELQLLKRRISDSQAIHNL